MTQLVNGLFDTGVDSSGNALAAGATDAHYTLTSAPSGVSTGAVVVASTLGSGWLGDNATDQWIAPTANQGSGASEPNGTYTYTTTFNATTVNGTAQLSGSILGAQNLVSASINGNSTAFTSTTNNYAAYVPFSLFGHIVQGTNTLSFTVSNTSGSGSEGIHVQGLALDNLPTVAADNAQVYITAGQTATDTGTFSDPDSGDTVTITASRGTVTQSGTNSGTWSISEATVTNGGPVVVTATDNHGGVASTSYTINIGAAPPPTLTSGGVAGNAIAGGSPVYADPNIVLTDFGPNLTTASISIGTNFSAANDRLLFTNQNGITGSYSTSTGILTLSGSATPAQYQTALRSIQYEDINPGETNDQPRTISFSLAAGTYNATNGHFYVFVRDPGITWLNAKAAADASTLYGLQGYLATLTSAAENTFAFSKTLSTGWIGASDAGNVGHWEWADGPENGLQFWQGLGNGVPVNGQYNDWNAGEPNDSGGVEFYAQYLSNGLWNDLANTATVNGYLVEYGGSTGDPALQLTSANTVNVATQTAAPTVTSPSGTETVNSPTVPIVGTAAAGSLVQVYDDANDDGLVDAGDTVVGTEQLAAGATSYSIGVPLTANVANTFVVTATASGSPQSNAVVVAPITYIPPPTITAGTGGPITVRAGGAAVVVDPGVTIVDTGPNLTGASVSIDNNFVPADDQLVFTNQNGITGSYNSSTGILSLSGSATAAQYQAALRSVAYQNTNPLTSNVMPRSFSFSIAVGAYDATNGHFYQFVSNPGITWTAAKVAADASSLYGLQGYLATITSQAEDVFAFSKTQTSGWIGASDPANNDVWTWSDGPESGQEIWIGRINGSPVNGAYTNWDVNQPDHAGGTEAYAQFVPDGKWNDLNNNYGGINGYLVEYGGSAGDPTLQLTSQATANVVSITDTPVVTGPGGSTAYVNAPNYTITGTADAGSLVTIYDDINNNGAVDLGEPVAGTEQLAAGQTSYSIPVALTQNAANHFLVDAIKNPANVSPFAPVTITSINTPPPRPTVLTPAVPVAVNASTVTVTGVAQANSLVQIYADANDNGSLDPGETLIASEQLTGGATSYSIPTTLAQNAVNHFVVTATDQAGNQSLAAAVPTVTEISTPPSRPTVTTPSTAISVNTTTDTILGVAAAGTLVQIFKGGTVVGTEQLAAGQTAFSIVVPLAMNAANSFTATATDAAGNQSTPTTIPTITENSIPPVAPTVITPAASVSINAGSYTITGTAQAGSLVQVYKDFNGNGSIDVGDYVVGSMQLAAGATSFSITVPLTQNAANHFLVTATDSATNQSIPVVVPTITADSVAPFAPTVLTPVVTTLVNTPTATVTGAAEANSLVRIYEDFNDNGGIDPGDVLVGTEQLTGGATAYSIPATLVANGTSHLLVTATDAAGNVSPPVQVPTINNDEIAPVVPIITSPALPTSINAGSVIISGTAEANSFVKVYKGNTVVGSQQLTGGSTTFHVEVPLAQNAASNFTVTSTDAATNQSVPAVVPTIIEDSIPPLAPINVTPAAPTFLNAATDTLTGTAEAGSLVDILAGNTVVGMEQLSPGQASYSIVVPLVQNAPNNFQVTSTDAAGNVSPATTVPTVVEDSIPPAVPVGTSPVVPTSINAATDTITGTAEAGSLVNLYDDGGTLLGTEQLGPDQTDYSITVPLVQNAPNEWFVTSTDAAGNVSLPLFVPTIVEDSIPPVAPVGISPVVPTVLNALDDTLTGTAEAGSLVNVYDADDNLVGTEQLDPDQTGYSIAVPLVQNAPNDFTVTSTDAAGNVSPTLIVPTIVEDSIPPLIPVGISPTVPTFLNAATDTLTGTAEAGSLVNVYADANENGTVDPGEVIVGTEQLGPDQTDYSITVPLAQNAPNDFLVTSTDSAGNVSPTLVVPTVVEDSIPPLIPVGISPVVPTSINAATDTLTGTAEAGSLVNVYSGDTVVGTEQLGPDQTSYSIAVPLAQNAPNDFTITSTDAAGNVSPTLTVPTITEDSIPPLIPVAISPTVPTFLNAATDTLTGTAEAGSLVNVYSGDTVVGTEQLGPDQTSYSIAVPLAQNATNDFTITSTDAAGNVSPTLTVPTVTEISIPPLTPIGGSPTHPTFVNATSTTLTGTAQAGSLVDVYDGDGNLVGTEQLGPDQTDYSITVPLAQNEPNHFTVTATDAAGNVSPSLNVPTITEISIPPVAPTLGSPSGPVSVNATTATLTGTAPAGSLVQIYGDTNDDGVVDGLEHVVGFEQLAPGQTSYSITVPLDPNSANHFLAVTTDAAGNASSTVVVPTITEDSISPLAPIGTSPSAATFVNATTQTLAGTAEAGSLVRVYADANGNGSIDPGELVVGFEQLAPGQTSYSITVPLVANSANHFLVDSTDAAGNVSPVAAVPTVTEISTIPLSPVEGSPTATTFVNATTQTLTGTAPAGSLVQVYADANANGKVDSGEVVVGFEQLAPGQTSYSITVPLAPNATNDFLVTATDAAGNVSPVLVVPPIVEISTPPIAPVEGSPSGPISVNATTATLTGTAPAGSLVQIYGDTNDNGQVDAGEVVVGFEQLAPGQTSYSITVPLDPNSANHFLAVATDAAGNASSVTVVPTITEISTVPASPTSGGPSSGLSVNSGTYTLTGLAPAGSLVTVYADINGVETVVGTEQLAPGQTSYSITVPLVQDSVNNFTVTSTDAAGNVSAPLVIPPIREASLGGTVFHDLNADGLPQAGEPGLAGRVVFLDLNHDGTLDPGDPTATTDANGDFSFPSYAQGAAPALEVPSQDAAGRYVVDQYSTNSDGSVSIAVTPISPIAPVPVVPSPFTATPATDANYAYVESLYAAVLGRVGSTPEVNGWLSSMAAGMTHVQVAAGFVNSLEHRTDQVDTYYQEYLHRSADPGSSVWINQLMTGTSEEQVSESILDSPEYQSSHQDPTLFVRDLYLDVLGRTGEDTGVAAWTGSGLTRDQIVARFVEGDEADGQIVDSFYSAYLHRQPEAVTSDPMLATLQAPGGSATTVATDMLASPEFAQDAQGVAATTTPTSPTGTSPTTTKPTGTNPGTQA